MTEIRKISNTEFNVNGVKVTPANYAKLPEKDRAVFEKYLENIGNKYVTKSILP
jgi:hypothetical protein